MSRQVDIKALVSHIVHGDGTDKCRICMGDTSEGQVYLGDTVMMDGDKPVTLAELLEVITGVEVPLYEELPSTLCAACSYSALSAAAFRTRCRLATDYWIKTLQLLETIPSPIDDRQKSIYAILKGDEITYVVDEYNAPSQCDTVDSDEAPVKPRKKRVKSIKQNYQCPDCGKAFIFPQHLYEHLTDSTDYKRSCYICASIMFRDELVEHLRKVHDTNVYDCKKCPALFQSLKKHKQHLTKAHASGAFSCGDCGRNFSTSHAFYGHLSVHVAKNCPSCDKLFRNHRCYLHHVKQCCNLDKTRNDTYHTKTKLMFEVKNDKTEKKIKVGVRGSSDTECICDYCGKKFAGKKFVSAHIQIVHMKNTHRPCPYCGKELAAAHINVHIKKHEETNTFTCEHCGIVLKTKLGYMQHIRLHTGERPYPCKYCSETFSASSRRSEHIRKTHKSADELILKHACEKCPARFRLPYRLRKHISTVHGEATDDKKRDYECPECHIRFSTCRGLLHHSRKHQVPILKSN